MRAQAAKSERGVAASAASGPGDAKEESGKGTRKVRTSGTPSPCPAALSGHKAPPTPSSCRGSCTAIATALACDPSGPQYVSASGEPLAALPIPTIPPLWPCSRSGIGGPPTEVAALRQGFAEHGSQWSKARARALLPRTPPSPVANAARHRSSDRLLIGALPRPVRSLLLLQRSSADPVCRRPESEDAGRDPHQGRLPWPPRRGAGRRPEGPGGEEEAAQPEGGPRDNADARCEYEHSGC